MYSEKQLKHIFGNMKLALKCPEEDIQGRVYHLNGDLSTSLPGEKVVEGCSSERGPNMQYPKDKRGSGLLEE